MLTHLKPGADDHQRPFDWSGIKALSEEDLYSLIPRPSFRFKTPPWPHQLAAFVAAVIDIRFGCGGFLAALDMGTGKTKVAIDVVRYFGEEKGRDPRALVICLNNAVENWCDEVGLHSDLASIAVRGGPKVRWELLLNSEANIKAINFESLRALLTVKTRDPRPGGKKNQLSPSLVGELMGSMRPDFIIIDESHLIKSPSSLNYKMCNALVAYSAGAFGTYRMELTGTPFGNTHLDVWSQYSLLDFGETFYPTFKEFKDAYFKDQGYYHGWRWQEKWVPTELGRDEIRDRIYAHALRYSEEEVEGLPEKTYKTVHYDLSPAQRKAYDDNVNALKKALGDTEAGFFVSGSEIAERRLLCRYICSGYIKASGKSRYDRLKQNAKLEALIETLHEVLLSGHKAVVFHEFIPEGEMLVEAIRKRLKVKVAVLSGAVKDKHTEWSRKFQRGNYPVIVANNAVGSQSINLTEATYCLFYSNSHRVINRMQAEKRVHRGGQTQRTYFYDFVGRGTVEEGILRVLWKHRQGIDETLNREDREIYGLGD